MREYGWFMGERVQVYGRPLATVMAARVGQHDEVVHSTLSSVYRFTCDIVTTTTSGSVSAYRAYDLAAAQRIMAAFKTHCELAGSLKEEI